MSRIANNSFKVNSALEQIVEISNASAIPVSEDSDIVKWGGVATSLGAKASSASVPVVLASDQATLPVSVTEADVDLIKVGGTAIAIGQAAMGASLPVALASDQSALETDLAKFGGSAVTIGQKAKSASIPVTLASDEDSLTVITSAGTNASTAISSSQVAGAGDFSTSAADVSQKTNVTIAGDGNNTSDAIEIHVSVDGTNFISTGFSVFPDSNGNFYYNLGKVALSKVKVKYTGAGTYTTHVGAGTN